MRMNYHGAGSVSSVFEIREKVGHKNPCISTISQPILMMMVATVLM